MTRRGRSQSGRSGESDGRKAPPTAAQRRAREDLGRSSRAWSDLTEEQRIAWRQRAGQVGRLRRLGQYYRLKGQQLFNKLNSVLALCDQEPLTDPPPVPSFGPNPVGVLTITRIGHALTLKLTLTGPVAEHIMVFASPPFNAGRGYCSDYRFIGLLSTPGRTRGRDHPSIHQEIRRASAQFPHLHPRVAASGRLGTPGPDAADQCPRAALAHGGESPGGPPNQREQGLRIWSR